jgi:hypothetical protein
MKYYYDIDGVVANTYPHLFEYLGEPFKEITEYGDPIFMELLQRVNHDWDFWLSIPVLHRPDRKPNGYISHRTQPPCITSYWLALNELPYAPVHRLYHNQCKTTRMEPGGILVDDNPKVFDSVRAKGGECLLMDASYNRHIQTDKRIYSLEL